MKKIKTNKGEIIKVDDDDFYHLTQFTWCVNGRGYAVSWIDGKLRLMHRMVMCVEDSKIKVDHIFHDKLDNRKSKLRLCEHKNNMKNCKKRKNNTSGFKGVVMHGKKWRAQITVNKNHVIIGSTYLSKIEAANAYNIAAIKHHGEFANLNDLTKEYL